MKIYIHHSYTYEIFWYFFHATKPIEKIPTWFESNRFDKTKKIDDIVEVITTYKENTIQCIFCNDEYWNKKDGYHIWDYSLYHYQKKNISDRGWNLILGKDLEHKIIPMLNKYSKLTNNKLSVFFIDWEFGDAQLTPNLNKMLDNNITLYKDELTDIVTTQRVSFTHILWSFIFPNTIKLREYYFLSEYLKYKKDYKYKINYPIRRITHPKNRLANYILNKNNKDFNITISSFTKYYNDKTRHSDKKKHYYNDLKEKIGNENVISKRGYNFYDWGGEWNDNNMSEFMYKLMDISEVNLIHEHSYGWNINEKSFMHILSNKPFVPTHDGTFKFYNEILKTYNIPKKDNIFDSKKLPKKIDYLDEISRDDKRWNTFVGDLKDYINYYRNSLLHIMNNHNGYLDNILSEIPKKNIL